MMPIYYLANARLAVTCFHGDTKKIRFIADIVENTSTQEHSQIRK